MSATLQQATTRRNPQSDVANLENKSETAKKKGRKIMRMLANVYINYGTRVRTGAFQKLSFTFHKAVEKPVDRAFQGCRPFLDVSPTLHTASTLPNLATFSPLLEVL